MIDTHQRRDAIYAFMELTLFACALCLLIPPVPSDHSRVELGFGTGLIAMLAFAASRSLALYRRRSAVVYSLAEVLVFCVFTAVLVMRFQIR